MVCKRCQERGKPWEGEDPVCAFNENIFDKENWNCATMSYLRQLAWDQFEKGQGFYYRNDMASESIGVIPFETENYQGNLVLTWYKERGRTGNAVIVCGSNDPQPLTIEIAEEILKKFKV
jgi:hypothetical protein